MLILGNKLRHRRIIIRFYVPIFLYSIYVFLLIFPNPKWEELIEQFSNIDLKKIFPNNGQPELYLLIRYQAENISLLDVFVIELKTKT